MSNAYEFLYQEDIYQASQTTLILINQPWASMSDGDKVLLNKILSSVKVSIDQVTILEATNVSLAALRQYNPSKIIAFGTVITESEGFYKNQQLGNITFISSDALYLLDDVKKKNLWAALKQMFT